uniref:UV excision repair protein RAD23 putative n=1 Tax=Albugo laibachii Nc14 TaxID=890382 RepID=F0WKY8_9STRA|nr:UV excision repair protein RAD23 putative [Albugo laibachii Nc14]|eukprot:CCA21947.1 UV excision repair protein RAD23 putative [Albugo laibachii Nc14]
MKLTVKTLQGNAFSIEAEPTDTVAVVKTKIQETQEFPAIQQKLIHAGKILKDDTALSEYNIKENDFIVVMVSKAKGSRPTSALPSTATAQTPTVPPPVPSTSAVSSSETSTPLSVSSSTRPTTEGTMASGSSGTSTTPSSTAEAANVGQLCDMGFPEEQVRSCLQAAFGNPDRAVEYLMNGIPENLVNPTSAAAAPTTGGPSAGSLEQLRNHPQFASFREVVRTNPAALPALLQQIGGQNPELLRLIHENQSQFLQMLNEESTAPSTVPTQGGQDAAGGGPTLSAEHIQRLLASLSPAQMAQMAAQMGLSPEQLRDVSHMLGELPPGALEQLARAYGGGGGATGESGGHRIMLSEEEAAAVDRLCDMGFERSEAAQAYLACEKNEALAANLLMDSMNENTGPSSNSGSGSTGEGGDDIYN